jgi:hypothetical protein
MNCEDSLPHLHDAPIVNHPSPLEGKDSGDITCLGDPYEVSRATRPPSSSLCREASKPAGEQSVAPRSSRMAPDHAATRVGSRLCGEALTRRKRRRRDDTFQPLADHTRSSRLVWRRVSYTDGLDTTSILLPNYLGETRDAGLAKTRREAMTFLGEVQHQKEDVATDIWQLGDSDCVDPEIYGWHRARDRSLDEWILVCSTAQANRPRQGRGQQFDATCGYPGEGPCGCQHVNTIDHSGDFVRECSIGLYCTFAGHYHRKQAAGARRRMLEKSRKPKSKQREAAYEQCQFEVPQGCSIGGHAHSKTQVAARHTCAGMMDVGADLYREMSTSNGLTPDSTQATPAMGAEALASTDALDDYHVEDINVRHLNRCEYCTLPMPRAELTRIPYGMCCRECVALFDVEEEEAEEKDLGITIVDDQFVPVTDIQWQRPEAPKGVVHFGVPRDSKPSAPPLDPPASVAVIPAPSAPPLVPLAPPVTTYVVHKALGRVPPTNLSVPQYIPGEQGGHPPDFGVVAWNTLFPTIRHRTAIQPEELQAQRRRLRVVGPPPIDPDRHLRGYFDQLLEVGYTRIYYEFSGALVKGRRVSRSPFGHDTAFKVARYFLGSKKKFRTSQLPSRPETEKAVAAARQEIVTLFGSYVIDNRDDQKEIDYLDRIYSECKIERVSMLFVREALQDASLTKVREVCIADTFNQTLVSLIRQFVGQHRYFRSLARDEILYTSTVNCICNRLYLRGLNLNSACNPTRTLKPLNSSIGPVAKHSPTGPSTVFGQ